MTRRSLAELVRLPRAAPAPAPRPAAEGRPPFPDTFGQFSPGQLAAWREYMQEKQRAWEQYMDREHPNTRTFR